MQRRPVCPRSPARDCGPAPPGLEGQDVAGASFAHPELGGGGMKAALWAGLEAKRASHLASATQARTHGTASSCLPPPAFRPSPGTASLPSRDVLAFTWEQFRLLPPRKLRLWEPWSRFQCYDMVRSRVTLVAQHESVQHRVHVCTKLVEPFQAQPGSLYMVLGEYDRSDDTVSMVKARVLTCVEGINLPLLEQAIQKQRKYHQERDHQQGKGSQGHGQESKNDS
uniref:TEN1 subunit of CST complex n=1 Tax=Sarcophilus harrisii TaxID=9305 RepID=G3WYW2_SARHA